MRIILLVLGVLVFLPACSSELTPKKTAYHVTCRTHARTATFSGSPDEQEKYLECMKIKGRHDIEVTEMEE